MEEKKYYTPTIEEFHRGFVYEYNSKTMFGWLNDTKGEWKQVDFYGGGGAEDESSEIEDIEFALDKEKEGIEVRVKYLDEDDIESLGWKHEAAKMKGSPLLVFSHSDLELTFDTEDRQVWIRDKEESIFNGIVKNKSRLSLLMQMVGII